MALSRGNVNALNETVIDELTECFRQLAEDEDTKAVIFTGEGKFCTFGFDIPEFLRYPRDAFVRSLTKFTSLYTDIFLYPKPVVAALNGHTIAGGCMLAISCDYRLMVPGKAKISLNEINFGSSLFAGSVEMMKSWIGTKNAERAVFAGNMYGSDEALRMGLIDRIVAPEELRAEADKAARHCAEKDGAAFKSIGSSPKKLHLKRLWRYSYPASCHKALHQWCSMARESGIPALVSFANMLTRYSYGIINHCRHAIHTSRLEGINNKIKVIKRKAFGFHDEE